MKYVLNIFHTYFIPCSSVSIVNFEHVISGWVTIPLTNTQQTFTCLKSTIETLEKVVNFEHILHLRVTCCQYETIPVLIIYRIYLYYFNYQLDIYSMPFHIMRFYFCFRVKDPKRIVLQIHRVKSQRIPENTVFGNFFM